MFITQDVFINNEKHRFKIIEDVLPGYKTTKGYVSSNDIYNFKRSNMLEVFKYQYIDCFCEQDDEY
jgi:hypothetical protein